MGKDIRYKNAKHLIDGGHIKTIKEIFDNEIIPKKVVLQDLGLNPVRFNKLIDRPEEFVISDLFRFADLFEVEEETILKLMFTQYLQNKKPKKKK